MFSAYELVAMQSCCQHISRIKIKGKRKANRNNWRGLRIPEIHADPPLSSMMSDSQGRPSDYLPSPGQPPIPWRQWKVSFAVYQMKKEIHLERLQRAHPDGAEEAAAVQQPAAYSDREKNLALFSCLGAGGQRLFHGTEDSANFDRLP
ncbi:MAG: hypothetical protein GY696_10330, partial [Gammaproteobacteria bacterium]|nr:hypothetical protein [Gammaproteobacteria bacterium]